MTMTTWNGHVPDRDATDNYRHYEPNAEVIVCEECAEAYAQDEEWQEVLPEASFEMNLKDEVIEDDEDDTGRVWGEVLVSTYVCEHCDQQMKLETKI